MSTTMSMRMPDELSSQIDKIADATGQTKSSIAIQALQEYVHKESWQLEEIQEALKEAENNDFVPKEDMDAFWARWIG